MAEPVSQPVVVTAQLVRGPPPRLIAAADSNDVMFEQLEELITHKQACPTPVDCPACKRWADVRKILMEIFK